MSTVRIQVRRGTASEWNSANPILAAGEMGVETDTLKFKIGNGSSTWTQITTYANVTSSGLDTSLGDYILAADQGTPGGPAELNSSGELIIPESSVVLWNDAAYDYTTTLTATQPTADRAITLPDATGTVALAENVAALSGATFTGAVSGTSLTLSGDLTVNGTTTTLSSTTISVDDKNIELGSVATPSDATADGGGITLKGSTDKTFNWVDATDAWTSSEHVNLASGKSLYLNGTLLKDATETLTNKTLTTPKINEDVTLTATATELNVLDGITSSTSELNILDGVTSTAAELNLLDGVTATTTELNYVDGVTSAIQTQLDNKLALTGGTMSGAIAMGTNKITGLGDPTSAQDAATKAYVDSATQGIDWKASVKTATTQDENLSTYPVAGDYMDAIPLYAGDRVLIKNQTDATLNGIYVVQASGAPVRSSDADTNAEVTANFAVFVEQGTVNADQGYVLTTDGAITIGTTALTFTQFTGLGQIVAGTGLDKTGNTLDIDSTVVTLTGTQTLTNKTLTSPVINTPTGITKSDVGLANVDNTADSDKPVSTATQTALDAKLASATAATTYETITNVALKASLESPALTGTPTAPTATAGTNSTQIATTAYADAAVAAIVDSAPGALNTLNELAAAINDDASYAAGITTALGLKAPLASPTFTGAVDFTGATVTGISSYSAPTLGSTSIASGATVTTVAGLTLTSPTLTGTLTAGGGTGTSGQVLASTGSGTQWVAAPAPTFHSVFAMV